MRSGAGVLLRLLEAGKPVEALSDAEITDILAFANAIGSLVTTKRGAIAAIRRERNRALHA